MAGVNGITIVGGGLAGAEAAWQIANRGIKVTLYEMRPERLTPAHTSGLIGELVCSNSLGSYDPFNAGGLLKQEMRRLNSLIMQAADAASIPAGGALAVDRSEFAEFLTDKLSSLPNVVIIRDEVEDILDLDGQLSIIATGPLTSQKLAESIIAYFGLSSFYFYDAAAPVLTTDSVDTSVAYWASRYDKGTPDYLNCPMNEEQYKSFYDALITAERTPLHDFEEMKVFEGCMPIEQMADRGIDTIRYGPLRPVGLIDPNTGKIPYAVVQLRKDNRDGTLLNIVGFQTRLKWSEQIRVFRMIPGLSKAEFVRLGVMHRNTYIDSPKRLTSTLQARQNGSLFFAGQLTGVEGYIESAAAGLVAGINAARLLVGEQPIVFPRETMIGALIDYITSTPTEPFQPMNANMGILPPLDVRVKSKKQRYEQYHNRSLDSLSKVLKIVTV